MNKESIEEERYDLLDHWLMWYGGFNATLIGKILGMTRQNVSILIRNYRNSRPPETLEYDASKKMHVVGKGIRSQEQHAKIASFPGSLERSGTYYDV